MTGSGEKPLLALSWEVCTGLRAVQSLLCASNPWCATEFYFLVQYYLCRWKTPYLVPSLNYPLSLLCVSSGKDATDTSLYSHVWQQQLQQEPVSDKRRQLWGALLPWQQSPLGVSGSSDPAFSTQCGLLSWCKLHTQLTVWPGLMCLRKGNMCSKSRMYHIHGLGRGSRGWPAVITCALPECSMQ